MQYLNTSCASVETVSSCGGIAVFCVYEIAILRDA